MKTEIACLSTVNGVKGHYHTPPNNLKLQLLSVEAMG